MSTTGACRSPIRMIAPSDCSTMIEKDGNPMGPSPANMADEGELPSLAALWPNSSPSMCADEHCPAAVSPVPFDSASSL